MRLAIFDMDGTLIPGYMERPKEQDYGTVELLPGRKERLTALHEDGVKLAIATNQAGAAFGYQEPGDAARKVATVIARLGVPVAAYICEAHEKAKVEALRYGSGRRKPSPVMLWEAMTDAGVGPAETIMVGDMDTDREAAEWADVRYFDAEVFFRYASADEFARAYAERSGVTVEWLRERGRTARPCDCGADSCEGWQMAREYVDA